MVFAETNDYQTRFGEVLDVDKLEALLVDASNMLLSAYEDFYGEEYVADAHKAFDRSATSVCCSIVSRALSTPVDFAGATQRMEVAGSYTTQLIYGAPAGDLYITKSELKRLGLVGQQIGSMHPLMRD